ncbi:MAG TPA: vanadium-dependent haloperoxidase [Pyrinomonadaceae bacterium]|nr:vanadium-dependent haloperoxidase [Pyrinomonadaceae bacterium]
MKENRVQPNRRQFLGKVGVASAASVAGIVTIEPLLGSARSEAMGAERSNQRANYCAKLRRDAAQANLLETPQNLSHPANTDEVIYPTKLGSYSKGLPHHSDGTVELSAYNAFLNAIHSGRPVDFDSIPMGGDRRLTNPQAGLAFDLEGIDAHALVQPPAPAFASREQAAEISENYWMALLRDVPFSEYPSNPIADAAAGDLNTYGTDFKGAKTSGQVTPGNLFRGLTSGDQMGPYLSQYFYQTCSFGANNLDQRIRTTLPGVNFMTDFGTWLAVQRGFSQPVEALDPTPRYMRSGRDIGQWVHIDVLFQAYFHGFLILLGLGAPVDDGNPYSGNPSQDGFGTFGGPHIATLLCEVATRALKAVWYQKWFVHRRLRPEVHAARVDRTLYHGAGYPIHPEILDSLSSSTRLGGYLPAGNALLPMAFPEGSPTHPAYGAGHATVAGACVTILKAWFNESTKLVDLGVTPVEPSPDGLGLLPYAGSNAGELTVGGELNKLASNVAVGRNLAGVHWRSDATESIKLGEQIAVGLLKDQRDCYNEIFQGFSLTKFDGTTVMV